MKAIAIIIVVALIGTLIAVLLENRSESATGDGPSSKPASCPAISDVVTKTASGQGVVLKAAFPSEGEAGGKMFCDLSAENKSDKDVTIFFDPGCWLANFKVTILNSDSETVALTECGKAHVKYEGAKFRMTIKPGHTSSMKVNIARLYDLTVSGKYSVTIEWQNSDKTIILKTEPFVFEVNDPRE